MELTTGVRVGQMLGSVRDVLTGADEALLCVAFAQAAGVNLIAPRLPARTRLLVTTAFGSTTVEALELTRKAGVEVRVLNPKHGTYHPKVYIGRHGKETRALVGSANLTGGLLSNIEAGTSLTGPSSHPELHDRWEQAEHWWADPRVTPVDAVPIAALRESLSPDLQAWITVLTNTTVHTVATGRPNRIVEMTPHVIYVETSSSTTPQPVPAWMVNVAWERMQSTGELTNTFLLADDGLNVKRSSFVCALLATLPQVEVASRRPVMLRLGGWTS